MRLGLDTTIPSHETIGRVFGMRISPTSLTRGSGARWVGYVGGACLEDGRSDRRQDKLALGQQGQD